MSFRCLKRARTEHQSRTPENSQTQIRLNKDMEQPVVHHVELCVEDRNRSVSVLQKFGFKIFAKRFTPSSKEIVTKLGASTFFLIKERNENLKEDLKQVDLSLKEDVVSFPSLLCCEHLNAHSVDTVFNVALCVKNVKNLTERIISRGGSLIVPPKTVHDQFGFVEFSVVRSICGNVIHTLINKSKYSGPFLPGFEAEEDTSHCSPDVLQDVMTHVDHVTLACHAGDSSRVISFYQSCFGMQQFSISRDDHEDEGLILSDGIGIRLRAMEYFRCAETGLIYPPSSRDRERNSNSVMFVVVESLPGQTNCQVETFLREHEGPGIEHVAISTKNIYQSITQMNMMGCEFRKPPIAYYTELRKTPAIRDIGEDLATLEKLGVLLDNEACSENETPKYLMQIFALPIFSRKTFFIEVIQRNGARGLGAANILALVRSIREAEKSKLSESKTQEIKKEIVTSPRRVC